MPSNPYQILPVRSAELGPWHVTCYCCYTFFHFCSFCFAYFEAILLDTVRLEILQSSCEHCYLATHIISSVDFTKYI